jgi:hypothetical protein
VISQDFNYRMKCQSCGTEVACSSCAVCGALLVEVISDLDKTSGVPEDLLKQYVTAVRALAQRDSVKALPRGEREQFLLEAGKYINATLEGLWDAADCLKDAIERVTKAEARIVALTRPVMDKEAHSYPERLRCCHDDCNIADAMNYVIAARAKENI